MLNKQQQIVHDAALKNLYTGRKQVFEYSGRSGTGKTYTLRKICEDSGIPEKNILPMAFTGAAAAVLRKKGFLRATTLHAGLFAPKQVKNPAFYEAKHDSKEFNHQFGLPKVPSMITKFVPKTSLGHTELIVIDEGYMCPRFMKDIIEQYNLPVIVTGDMRQLPPVKDMPAYLAGDNIPELTETMRQEADSPIVYIANRILQGLPIHCGNYGNRVLVIEENDLTPEMLKCSNMILAGTNYTRDYWNTKIREEIWGYDSPLPMYGERVICRQNNHNNAVNSIELANGLMGYSVSNPDVSTFNGKYFRMDFLPDLLYEPFKNLLCDYEYFSASPKERRDYHNPYNFGEKFEFAYCITTHLSQGSEAERGIYFSEIINHGGAEYQKRLDYTAVTRFKQFMILVKPKRRFF